MSALKSENSALRTRLSQVEARLDTDSIDRYRMDRHTETIKALCDRLKRYKADEAALRDELRTTDAALREVNFRLAAVESSLERATQQSRFHEERLRESEAARRAQADDVAGLTDRLNEMKQRLRDALRAREDADAALAIARREREQERDLRSSVETQLLQMQREVSALQASLSMRTEENETLRSQHEGVTRQFDELQRRVQEEARRRNDLESEFDTILTAISSI